LGVVVGLIRATGATLGFMFLTKKAVLVLVLWPWDKKDKKVEESRGNRESSGRF
jgi:hypothetical protein